MRSSSSIVGALALFCLLAGPAPGKVGGCDAEVGLADAQNFCVDKNTWICARNLARGDYNDECSATGVCTSCEDVAGTQCECPCRLASDCTGAVAAECRNAQWGSSCHPPTTLQTDACIDALRSVDRLGDPFDSIVECQMSTLCGTSEASP